MTAGSWPGRARRRRSGEEGSGARSRLRCRLWRGLGRGCGRGFGCGFGGRGFGRRGGRRGEGGGAGAVGHRVPDRCAPVAAEADGGVFVAAGERLERVVGPADGLRVDRAPRVAHAHAAQVGELVNARPGEQRGGRFGRWCRWPSHGLRGGGDGRFDCCGGGVVVRPMAAGNQPAERCERARADADVAGVPPPGEMHMRNARGGGKTCRLSRSVRRSTRAVVVCVHQHEIWGREAVVAGLGGG